MGRPISDGFSREDLIDKEIFHLKPIILSGSPTDPANMIVVDRAEHIQLVRFWNKVVREAREGAR